jgi:hypothetical protein
LESMSNPAFIPIPISSEGLSCNDFFLSFGRSAFEKGAAASDFRIKN